MNVLRLKGRVSRDGYLSEQQPGDQVTDADGDKGGDDALLYHQFQTAVYLLNRLSA